MVDLYQFIPAQIAAVGPLEEALSLTSSSFFVFATLTHAHTKQRESQVAFKSRRMKSKSVRIILIISGRVCGGGGNTAATTHKDNNDFLSFGCSPRDNGGQSPNKRGRTMTRS
jgi:hypothetical protein